MPDTQASRTTVFGIYLRYQDMERGIDRLKAEGFLNTDISVLLPENVGPGPLAPAKRNRAERAAAGGFSGALVGGTLGWLAGIGVIAIPGFGPLLAAGPILAALAGLGVGGTVAGVAGALMGTGIPEKEAAKYEGQLKKGAIMISVYAEANSAERAQQVLLSTGAGDITLANRRSSQSAK
ncbi:MAG TPA: hypothetical protein VFW94_23155 [Candidatus Acidoferrales bacterium]|nr:hypothetical protein [Candidatus Acidoferrales bacterium]